MKLDRNINPDGSGKYALINLRTQKIEWGNTPATEFFVIKIKDRFAEQAFHGYIKAIRDYIRKNPDNLSDKELNSLEEYKVEIMGLRLKAKFHPDMKTPD